MLHLRDTQVIVISAQYISSSLPFSPSSPQYLTKEGRHRNVSHCDYGVDVLRVHFQPSHWYAFHVVVTGQAFFSVNALVCRWCVVVVVAFLACKFVRFRHRPTCIPDVAWCPAVRAYHAYTSRHVALAVHCSGHPVRNRYDNVQLCPWHVLPISVTFAVQ